MKRVVVTGMGIVSCLGNDTDSVSRSLRDGSPGITRVPEYEELGLRSQVAGVPQIDLEADDDPQVIFETLNARGASTVHAAVGSEPCWLWRP